MCLVCCQEIVLMTLNYIQELLVIIRYKLFQEYKVFHNIVDGIFKILKSLFTLLCTGIVLATTLLQLQISSTHILLDFLEVRLAHRVRSKLLDHLH